MHWLEVQAAQHVPMGMNVHQQLLPQKLFAQQAPTVRAVVLPVSRVRLATTALQCMMTWCISVTGATTLSAVQIFARNVKLERNARTKTRQEQTVLMVNTVLVEPRPAPCVLQDTTVPLLPKMSTQSSALKGSGVRLVPLSARPVMLATPAPREVHHVIQFEQNVLWDTTA